MADTARGKSWLLKKRKKRAKKEKRPKGKMAVAKGHLFFSIRIFFSLHHFPIFFSVSFLPSFSRDGGCGEGRGGRAQRAPL
jgi:cyanate permease